MAKAFKVTPRPSLGVITSTKPVKLSFKPVEIGQIHRAVILDCEADYLDRALYALDGDGVIHAPDLSPITHQSTQHHRQ
ncbi:hypothetical protein [Bradyrhizobium elkanii]|uniref:hypothetical protein n=1 Tax=Bradyrhizobium elkanii TaxID=29448 RepID=UPI0021698AC1|nr:hypothetical protein [Bradyrhizobium elkanii]MCS3689067.1 hypothetical protein [Bradyrhizobium elkanii]